MDFPQGADSKFRFILVAAKRARQLQSGAKPLIQVPSKKVTKIGEVEIGGLPEAVGFSPDGKYLYAGNFIDGDMSILKVDGTKLTDTGKRMKIDGHPVAMRVSPPK